MFRPSPNFAPPPALQSRLHRHVDVLAGLIGERNSAFPQNLTATRKYIASTLGELGLAPTQHTYQTTSRPAVNIEVILPGSQPQLPPLIVGAHYDTNPGTPGADDNASAVAALLEIARAAAGAKLKRTLHCVFYDCEEMPFFATGGMGSAEHARGLRAANKEILGMICLESIGYFTRRVDPSVQRPRIVRFFDAIFGGSHICLVSNFASIPFGLAFTFRFATSGLFRFLPAAMPEAFVYHKLSDHRSYWDQNYPALMVTNTAILRNPHYHQRSDLPPTLDYPRLAKLTKMLSRVVLRTCR